VKGPPGAGKSDIVAQACADLECPKTKKPASLLIMHPAVSDPTDYKGMPAIVPNEKLKIQNEKFGGLRAEFLPFGDLNKLIEADHLTVAFLDDIGQSPPAVQAALMQLILARRVNGHCLSEHVVFCGATNDTHHMAGVAGMLEPVKSRWDSIVELEVSLEDWCEWALDHDLPPEIIAFIRFRPGLLNDFKPTRELKNSPCPRTVAAVANWLKIGVKDYEVIAGAAGEGFATEFIAFLDLYTKLPSLDAILLDPDHAPVPESPATLYAVISGLARKATKTNCDRVFRYIKRLPKEFEVCCVRDAIRLCKAITVTATYVTWANKNQNVLL
jgi:hypothetical protein